MVGEVGRRPSFSEARPSLGGAGLDDELWVISRSSDPAAPTDNEFPGSGSLWTEVERRQIEVPLQHTDVQATIDGTVATVKVTQQFHNPYDSKIEAVYVFPLPDHAAVNEFLMVLGNRRIRGLIREREEAEKTYSAAKQQGYVASLLTQERPNVFVQSVANIEPGRQIDVSIAYFHSVPCVDDWFEFVFPMVVGPRFNPSSSRPGAGSSTGTGTGVGAVGRGKQGQSGQRTEVSYLKPQERSGHDLSLEVELRPGMKLEETSCPTHQIEIEQPEPDRAQIRLSAADRLPNRDFVLRYRLAGEQVKSSLLAHRDGRGGFFTLTLVPPRESRTAPRFRPPLELIFVLDSSGSMSGVPIEQAKAAIARGLQRLEPDDTFQIVDFSERASQFGPQPLAATSQNVARGRRYLEQVHSSGGTIMIHGIRAALDFAHDPRRLRFVCFLTDGYVGNELEILREIQKRLQATRIFSFGVGSAPNRYLLNSMARLGRGAVAYLGSNDDAVKVMDQFFERVAQPVLTDIRVDYGGWPAGEVYPRRVPDLFAGRPVTLTGRFESTSNVPKVVRVTAQAGHERVQLELPVQFAARSESKTAFPSLWARAKLTDLYERVSYGLDPFKPAAIRQLALDYGLLSDYTAFVTVDASARTAGRSGTTVPVPVPVPEGVKYKTTVDE
jgi:Ca-activated chloride channel family protein